MKYLLYSQKAIATLKFLIKELLKGPLYVTEVIANEYVRNLVTNGQSVKKSTIDRRIRELIAELKGRGRGKQSLIIISRGEVYPKKHQILGITEAGKKLLEEINAMQEQEDDEDDEYLREYSLAIYFPTETVLLSESKYEEIETEVFNSNFDCPVDRISAELVITHNQSISLDIYGGYPLRCEKSFEVNGERYTVIAWGVSEENGGEDAISGMAFVLESMKRNYEIRSVIQQIS